MPLPRSAQYLRRMTATDAALSPSASPSVGGRIGFLLLGIIFLLCGLFAFLAPIASTLATMFVISGALVVAGLSQVAHAVRSPAWKGFFLHLLLGIVYVAGAAIFMFRPLTSALVVTVWLSWMLLLTGVGEMALAFRIRPQNGWGWMLFSGLIALLCGVWLLMRIPIAGFFVPGIALAIALVSEGFAFIALAMGRKRGRPFQEGLEAGTASSVRMGPDISR